MMLTSLPNDVSSLPCELCLSLLILFPSYCRMNSAPPVACIVLWWYVFISYLVDGFRPTISTFIAPGVLRRKLERSKSESSENLLITWKYKQWSKNANSVSTFDDTRMIELASENIFFHFLLQLSSLSFHYCFYQIGIHLLFLRWSEFILWSYISYIHH